MTAAPALCGFAVVAAGPDDVALPADRVREVVPWDGRAVQPPRSAGHALGLLRVRDDVVPVTDLRRLVWGQAAGGDPRYVVVLATGAGLCGVAVDGIRELLRAAPDELRLYAGQRGALLPGVIARGGGIVHIIDPDALIAEAGAVAPAGARRGGHGEAVRVGASRHLLVTCAGRCFAIDIAAVRRLVADPRLASFNLPVPHLLGAVTLEGGVVPVIDLPLVLGIAGPAPGKGKREGQARAGDDGGRILMVLERGSDLVGILISGIAGVADLAAADIRPFPGAWRRLDPMVRGVMAADPTGGGGPAQPVVVLDHDRIFAEADVAAICRLHRGLGLEAGRVSATRPTAAPVDMIGFHCDGERFWTRLDAVAEVRRFPAGMECVADAGLVLGFIEHQETLMPLICFRTLCGKQPTTPTRDTRVLVVATDTARFGFVVDATDGMDRVTMLDAGGVPPAAGGRNALARTVTRIVVAERRGQRESMPVLDMDELAMRLERNLESEAVARRGGASPVFRLA